MYEEYLQVADRLSKELESLSDKIWDMPELAFAENRSAALLSDYLKKEGFEVTCPAYGVETAFVGSYGSGRPYIGVLGEYDALANLSQKAGVLEKDSLKKGESGHGCGHNLLGVGSLAAALIVKEYLEKTGKPGTIFYYGCPGEEGGSGKAFMAREGAFQDLDAALCWHPAELNEVMQESSLANVQVRYRFKGVSAHAAENPEDGRSALDALELMNVGVNFLREHMNGHAKIHYAITDAGGSSPNVVQSCAEAVYLIRDTDLKKAYELWDRVNKIAQGMAMATETEVEWSMMKSCSNLVSNRVLERTLYQSLCRVKRPNYSPEEKRFAKGITDSTAGKVESRLSKRMETMLLKENRDFLKKSQDNPIFEEIIPYEEKQPGLLSGSTDVGDVSWQCPTAQFRTATWAASSGGHSWQIVSQGKGGQAKKGMLYAGKVMGDTCIALFEHPEILKEAREEFAGEMDGKEYISIPKDILPGGKKLSAIEP